MVFPHFKGWILPEWALPTCCTVLQRRCLSCAVTCRNYLCWSILEIAYLGSQLCGRNLFVRMNFIFKIIRHVGIWQQTTKVDQTRCKFPWGFNNWCNLSRQSPTWELGPGSERVFATSLEVHYTKSLCDAHAFILKLVAMGMFFSQQPSLQQAVRASTLQQAPSTEVAPLVSTFKSRVVIFYKQEQLVWLLTFTENSACKLLRRFQVGDLVSAQSLRENQGVLDRLMSEFDKWSLDFDLHALSASFQFEFDAVKIFGVQCEPEEVLQKACEIGHPLSSALALPMGLAQSIEACARLGAATIAKERLEFFMFWNRRAKELQEEELRIRSTMDPLVENAFKGKRLELFRAQLCLCITSILIQVFWMSWSLVHPL